MEILPELYKDLKHEDKNGQIWFPSTVNLPKQGMVFANGSSIKNWEWVLFIGFWLEHMFI